MYFKILVKTSVQTDFLGKMVIEAGYRLLNSSFSVKKKSLLKLLMQIRIFFLDNGTSPISSVFPTICREGMLKGREIYLR